MLSAMRQIILRLKTFKKYPWFHRIHLIFQFARHSPALRQASVIVCSDLPLVRALYVHFRNINLLGYFLQFSPAELSVPFYEQWHGQTEVAPLFPH